MSRTEDVASVLGDYMLRGWVLTDQVCPTSGCYVPLLRSKDRSVTFCAKCDGSPERAATREAGGTAPGGGRDAASPSAMPPSPSSTPRTQRSPQSTPPTTPPSRSPSLPALSEPSPLTLQRRAQSDLASQRIGELLLKGWAMLGEECPNETCWGVPLVRRPGRPKGGRGDGGECVICGWGSEIAEQPTGGPSAPRSNQQQQSTPAEAEIVRSCYPPAAAQVRQPPPAPPAKPAPQIPQTVAPIPSSEPLSSPHPTPSIAYSISALEQTISALSERLLAISSNPLTADPTLIKTVVDAMSVVMDTLAKAKAMGA